MHLNLEFFMAWERNLRKRRQGEEIIRDLLEDSGYQVIPYGFDFLSNLASKLGRKKRTECKEFERQIRSTPDFVV